MQCEAVNFFICSSETEGQLPSLAQFSVGASDRITLAFTNVMWALPVKACPH